MGKGIIALDADSMLLDYNLAVYSGERDRGSVLRTLILCRCAFSAGFPFLVFGLF